MESGNIAENEGGMAATRDWWQAIPEDQRGVYLASGMSRPLRIEGKTALLVIDVTYAFTGTRSAPIMEAIQEFPTSCGEAAWDAIPYVRKLLDAFRSAQLPIAFTRSDLNARAAAGGATKPSRANDAEIWARGNHFPEPVQPLPGEYVCEKARASGFYGTPLTSFLHIQGVDSVVVCGGSTSGCVRASAVDAYSAGFKVFVAEEGCFDRARLPHLVNLFDLHAKYATVLMTEEIVAQIARK